MRKGKTAEEERGFPVPVLLGRSQKMLRTVTFVERYQGYESQKAERNRPEKDDYAMSASGKRCSWRLLI